MTKASVFFFLLKGGNSIQSGEILLAKVAFRGDIIGQACVHTLETSSSVETAAVHAPRLGVHLGLSVQQNPFAGNQFGGLT